MTSYVSAPDAMDNLDIYHYAPIELVEVHQTAPDEVVLSVQFGEGHGYRREGGHIVRGRQVILKPILVRLEHNPAMLELLTGPLGDWAERGVNVRLMVDLAQPLSTLRVPGDEDVVLPTAAIVECLMEEQQ